MSKNALQYRGNAQHDAQEFLLWLLDRVHEDLNHAVKQSSQPPVKVRVPHLEIKAQGAQGPFAQSSEELCHLHLVNVVIPSKL